MVCRPYPPAAGRRRARLRAGARASRATLTSAGTRTPAPPPPPGCQAGTGRQAIPLAASQAGIAATIAGVAARHRLPQAGGHHRLCDGPAGIEAAEPGLRRPRLRGRLPAAALAGLGHRRRARGPGLRHDEILRRPGPGARLHQDAGRPGRPGRAAQRGRVRLRAVGAVAAQLLAGVLHRHARRTACPAGTPRRAKANLAGR